jgi:ABC-type branched-subunit amino acid transport system substrate-binding protein
MKTYLLRLLALMSACITLACQPIKSELSVLAPSAFPLTLNMFNLRHLGPWSLALVPCALCLASCIPVTRPVVKIGLVAPFEGRYRDVGYEVIYAVRLAVREANAAGGIAGYSVELLALDDSGDPDMAVDQARKAATDPQVVGVIGDWLDATTLAAAHEYDSEGIPFLATTSAPNLPPSAFRLWLTEANLQATVPQSRHCPPPCDSLENLDWLIQQSSISNPQSPILGPPLWGQQQFVQLAGKAAEGVQFIAPAPLPADSTNPTFADRYRVISNGVEPRSYAVLAYDATQVLFDAIKRDVKMNHRRPTRAGVAAALAQTDTSGLSGHFSFDANHNWAEARGWMYEWREGRIAKP